VNLGRKKEKKILRCTVCGENAFGHNFDQITCESCKGKIDQQRKIGKLVFPI
jgi:ribosomal protein L37E